MEGWTGEDRRAKCRWNGRGKGLSFGGMVGDMRTEYGIK